jgi:hypothetical protein
VEQIVLSVNGQLERNLELTLTDLSQFPRRSIRAKDELGKESLFEGVLLDEILRAAGVKFGKELRGKRLADYSSWKLQMIIKLSLLCRSWTRRSERLLSCSPILAIENHSKEATAGSGSSSPTKNDMHDGSGKLSACGFAALQKITSNFDAYTSNDRTVALFPGGHRNPFRSTSLKVWLSSNRVS